MCVKCNRWDVPIIPGNAALLDDKDGVCHLVHRECPPYQMTLDLPDPDYMPPLVPPEKSRWEAQMDD